MCDAVVELSKVCAYCLVDRKRKYAETGSKIARCNVLCVLCKSVRNLCLLTLEQESNAILMLYYDGSGHFRFDCVRNGRGHVFHVNCRAERESCSDLFHPRQLERCSDGWPGAAGYGKSRAECSSKQ